MAVYFSQEELSRFLADEEVPWQHRYRRSFAEDDPWNGYVLPISIHQVSDLFSDEKLSLRPIGGYRHIDGEEVLSIICI